MNYRLNNNNIDVLFRTKPYAELSYFGKRLQNIQLEQLEMLNPAVPNARIDVDVPFTLCPEEGLGNFSTPGLEGHRNGKDWSPVFITKEVIQTENQITTQATDCSPAAAPILTRCRTRKNKFLTSLTLTSSTMTSRFVPKGELSLSCRFNF